MPIHNEEENLHRSLAPLKKANIIEFIAILDRCTDKSEEIVKKHFPKAKIIRKEDTKWRNSYAENLQLGYKASSGNLIGIHDADIESPPEVFDLLIEELQESVASVSAEIITDKTVSKMNFIYHYWEKTYQLTLGGKEPRGGVRLIKRDELDRVGGFKDVEAPDTQLDIDLSKIGYESSLIKGVVCIHFRAFSFRKAIRSQINSGMMRRGMGMPFWRVIGHSLVRLRPFVLYGYIKGKGDAK